MNNKVSNLKMLVEGGIMIALATVLSLVKVYEAPFGGSVTAGSMIPIIIFAIRWGIVPGLLVGTVYGIIQFLIEPWFVHPIQFLLDYPIAFGILGLAGIANYQNDTKKFQSYFLIGIGIFSAILGRFIAHLISGVVFFAEYAGELNPWVYSALYNGSYLIIEFLVSFVIIIVLWKYIKRIV